MPYRCEAESLPGFIQQLSVAYVSRGYWFYVVGTIPERKDPHVVDQKLVERYGIDVSLWTRARRRRAGGASMQYLRHNRFFVLLATRGHHHFFHEEEGVRDIRRVPLKYGGYSVSYRHSTRTGRGHASVRVEKGEYRALTDFFRTLAPHRSVEDLTDLMRSLPYEPYAPVRRQLLNLLRSVNQVRRAGGGELLPTSCLRLRRRILKPFVSLEVTSPTRS